MSEARKLKVVGYWHDEFDGKDWLHPSFLVDSGWELTDRDQIVRYLRSGVRIHEDLGYSHCRFANGPPDEQMGNADLSDGVWIWPEGLWIYVSVYSVRLPSDLIAHMRANDFRIPKRLSASRLEHVGAEFEYWKDWCNQNRRH
jgi:hypothetical protein